MTVKYLTDIKEFLERNVAPKISLRGIADKDDTTCLMVSPHVTVGLPITFDTPACVRDKIPGIVVGLAAPIEYSQEIVQIPVELAVVAYCPGTQDEFGLSYDNTGFWDVCNLSDLIVRELFAADTIGGLYLSDRVVQCRPDNEQYGDYWMGSVTFTVKAHGVPELRQRELL